MVQPSVHCMAHGACIQLIGTAGAWRQRSSHCCHKRAAATSPAEMPSPFNGCSRSGPSRSLCQYQRCKLSFTLTHCPVFVSSVWPHPEHTSHVSADEQRSQSWGHCSGRAPGGQGGSGAAGAAAGWTHWRRRDCGPRMRKQRGQEDAQAPAGYTDASLQQPPNHCAHPHPSTNTHAPHTPFCTCPSWVLESIRCSTLCRCPHRRHRRCSRCRRCTPGSCRLA